jgi:hypothetical protein
MRPIMTRTKGITSAATPREFDERRRCGFSFVRERLESLRLFSRMLREELGLLLDELGEFGLLALCGRFRFPRRCHHRSSFRRPSRCGA